MALNQSEAIPSGWLSSTSIPESQAFSGKRVFDLAVATILLLLLLPVMAAIALAIVVLQRGPVLYWDRRTGWKGREFLMPKFRSMVVDARASQAGLRSANLQGEDNLTFKLKDDPRVTSLGRWLRRTSLDELPQLFCVLSGDMSLVGPRPLPVEECRTLAPAYCRRVDVRPGLTCLWQVSGRSDLPFPRHMELDLEYVERQSFGLDLKLLALTIPAVLSGRGAY